MNALWNKKDLERPANNIWKPGRKSIDNKKFVSSLEIIIKDLESQNALHMEAAILSRLIYRMKSKFRNDKGLKNMEKVNRALLNYLQIDLLKEYKDLKNYVEWDGPVINLPTKQMVQYVLVRTQGFSKLMCRIENVSKCSAQFFKARINIGHAWTVSVIAYAVVSRIWYLSRYLLKRCCVWYNSIFEYVNKFKIIGPTWLPENYDLPSNLKTWLNLPWIDQATDSVPLKDDGKETIFGLIRAQIDDPYDLNIENENIESPTKNFDDSIEAVENDSKIGERFLSEAKDEVLCIADDIGMSIDRETFQSNLIAGLTDTPESIVVKESLKKNEEEVKEIELSSKSYAKRSNVLVTEDTDLPVPVKKRKKLMKIAEKEFDESLNSSEINSTVCKKDKKVKKSNRVESEGEKTALKIVKERKFKSNISKTNQRVNSSAAPSYDDTDKTKLKNSIPGNIKTRNDLIEFLNKDSYPGLDRLQWNMLINSVKKFVDKLEKFDSSDERREKILIKKVKFQIQNWIK